MPAPRRIVILGAGFGGLYALRRLHRLFIEEPVSFTIVNRENYFLFTPLLHEVATGGLAPHTIVEPLRKVAGAGVDVRVAEVLRVRLADRVVETSSGDVPYDALVIALGAETNFYGVPGADAHARTLKSLMDAIAIKRAIIGAFDAAAKDGARGDALTFAVVGGGPTGVELAAEMAELVHGSLVPAYRGSLGGVRPTVALLQQADELLPQFSPPMRTKALQALRGHGVDVRLGARVASVDQRGIAFADGARMDAALVVWTAGVMPTAVAFDADVERDAAGRLVVDAALGLKGRPGVFVVGDLASFLQDGRPLPPFAQVAVRQADRAAENVAAHLAGRAPAPFRYRSQGNLVSLGQWMAAAEIGPFRFGGHFAWWLWRTIYLTKFISFRKKFVIALQWTINLVSPRDISKI